MLAFDSWHQSVWSEGITRHWDWLRQCSGDIRSSLMLLAAMLHGQAVNPVLRGPKKAPCGVDLRVKGLSLRDSSIGRDRMGFSKIGS